MSWQPIETAPTDGSAVLIYSPAGVDKSYLSYEEGFPSHIVVGRYRSGQWITPFVTVETYGGSEYTGTWTETENITAEPTHWQPLPEPPEGKK